MACSDTAPQETTYSDMLLNSDSFEITDTGNLTVGLKENGGNMIFTPDVEATLQ
jgi:hypothetical protein